MTYAVYYRGIGARTFHIVDGITVTADTRERGRLAAMRAASGLYAADRINVYPLPSGRAATDAHRVVSPATMARLDAGGDIGDGHTR